jgi:hypothetical protein
MATTFNLLSYNNALLTLNDSKRVVPVGSYSHDWSSTNSVLSIISTNYLVDSRYVIQLSPSSASEIVLTLTDVPLRLSDNGRVLSFNMRIKALSSLNTATLIYLDGQSYGFEEFTQSFSSGEYNALQSNRLTVPDDDDLHTVDIRISITGHNANTIFLTCPHLIHDLAFYANPFVGYVRNYIPDFYWELDSAASNPTYPFFRLVDILSSAAGDTKSEYDQMYGYESAELITQDELVTNWAQSSLVSPGAIRDEYVNWLTQFTGERIHRNFQLADGSLYFDNPGLQRDFLEWQLYGSHYGRGAGTRHSMLEAAKQVLIKTKDGEASTQAVALTPSYGGDPFAIRVQTLTNETIDADVDESSDIVLQSVNLARPMGYVVTHNTVDEFFLTFDDISYGLLDGSISFG